ncbi:MAG: RDD family protein [Cytophagaceae bacterium]|nr:RDD family protein [Cytophagaceae bacterium]
MNTINIPTFLNIDLNFNLAGFGSRVAAYVIDWGFKIGYFFLIIQTFRFDIFSSNYILSFLAFIPLYFYTLLSEWLLKGQTLGKMAMKIKVIGNDGSVPSFSQCAVRWMFLLADGYIFMILILVSPLFAGLSVFSPAVGIIAITNTKNQQRLGDLAAGTYIVSTRENHFSIEDTIYAYANKRQNYQIKYPQVIKLSDKDMTIIQNLMEKSEKNIDYQLASKLSKRVKEILNIETQDNDIQFLKDLLSDYNRVSIEE